MCFKSGFIGGIRSCLFSIAVARLNVRLRKLLFSSLLQQEMGFFDKTSTGEMLSRLSADTSTMSDLISSNINGFLWNLVRTSRQSNIFSLFKTRLMLNMHSWHNDFRIQAQLAIVTHLCYWCADSICSR